MSDVLQELQDEIRKIASEKGRNLSEDQILIILRLAKDAMQTGRPPNSSKLTIQLQKLGKTNRGTSND